MKHIRTLVLAVVLVGSVTIAGDAPEMDITVRDMPPSVVSTVPQGGDTAVDPALTEVRVTFSKDMQTKDMWSWCSISEETFPKIDKTKIHYLDDKRTCVLPVTLEPDRTYVIWINTDKFNSFRDRQNHPAVPYLLVFQTAAEGGGETGE
ncbi:MAG: Ig-like domain-containing domain [Planctomycetota bacterium]|jgi:hypothetical protein